MNMGVLSIIMWLPFVGMLIVLAVPNSQPKLIHAAALGISAVTFGLSWGLLFNYNAADPGLQFVERVSWIPEMGMTYALGVDALGLVMLMLTTLMMLVALIVSVGSIRERIKAYFAWLMLLEFAIIGVFVSQDWFLFYMFWEITLIPMFFLIGIWGADRRGPASMSFFLYTLGGSIFMLLGIIAAYLNTPDHTFDMVRMAQASSAWTRDFQIVIFLAFFIGLAVKVPVFPLHGWLPLAHVEAPVPVSIILSGVLLKMGAYGLMRITDLVPIGIEWFAPWLFVLGTINILYGSLMAWRQTDLKAMIAFSSVGHMGFVLVGISALNAIGYTGALMQMFTHGIITGALFLLIGAIYERAHTREVTAFGGLAQQMPVYAVLTSMAFLASMSLPGLAGFISEIHALVGSFQRWGLWVIIATLGILITAAYSLRAIGKMFMGQFNMRWAHLQDLNARELVAVAPLAILMLVIGVYPGPMLRLMNATLTRLVAPFN